MLIYYYYFAHCFMLSKNGKIDTSIATIEDTFKAWVKRDDIAIILINQIVSSFPFLIFFAHLTYFEIILYKIQSDLRL